jgi:hypothetical protein
VKFVAFIPRTILPGGRARLQQGERVRIYSQEPKPVQIGFQPVRYDELQSSIVPDEVRNHPRLSILLA